MDFTSKVHQNHITLCPLAAIIAEKKTLPNAANTAKACAIVIPNVQWLDGVHMSKIATCIRFQLVE